MNENEAQKTFQQKRCRFSTRSPGESKILLHHREVITLFEELIHEPWGYKKWRPPVDIFEEDDLFVIKADLPGVKADSLNVSASDTKILIEGNRPSEARHENIKEHVCERPKGRFVREIEFLDTISPEHIETRLEDGVLTIVARKKS